MFLFKRKKKDDEPVHMEARSEKTGLKYKDIALLGQMVQQGADLTKPRHALYYLYFGSQEIAENGAADGRAAGYTCEVREPLPGYPDQWSLVCDRPDAELDIDGVRKADDLFQESPIASAASSTAGRRRSSRWPGPRSGGSSIPARIWQESATTLGR